MELNVDRDADLVRGCGWLRARGLASLYDTCEACILICAERATAHRAAASGAGLDLAVLSMDGRSRAGLAGDAPLIRLSRRQGAPRSEEWALGPPLRLAARLSSPGPPRPAARPPPHGGAAAVARGRVVGPGRHQAGSGGTAARRLHLALRRPRRLRL